MLNTNRTDEADADHQHRIGWADARSLRHPGGEASLIAARLPEYGKRYEAGASTAIDYADGRTLFEVSVSTPRAKYDLAFKSRILDFYMGKAMTFR